MNARALAAPLAGLYGAGVLLRRFAYDHGLLHSAAAPLFIISVGGLEAGGSGKTPVAGHLLHVLQSAGRRPGLLTRGYGRSGRGLALRLPGEPVDPALIGDEPAMLVRSGLDLPVAACARRSDGALALAEHGCDAAVMDDGFAHRAQARDLDIVVLRGEQPFGNGHLLPWGSLREPPSSLARAHVVWLHYRNAAILERPSWLDELCPAASWVVSEGRPSPPVDREGVPVGVRGRRVLAAAGIARPIDLAESLHRMDAEVAALVAFPDHHAFGPRDVAMLARTAEQQHAEAVVVTPKDAIKLGRLWRGPPLWVLGVEVAVRHGATELAARLGLHPEVVRQPCSATAHRPRAVPAVGTIDLFVAGTQHPPRRTDN